MDVKKVAIVGFLLADLLGTLFVGIFATWGLVTYFTNIGDKILSFATGGLGNTALITEQCKDLLPNEETYQRFLKVQPFIDHAAQYSGIPSAFIAGTALQESKFNPTAKSSFAEGIMQLANQRKYDTFDELSMKYRTDYENNYNPTTGNPTGDRDTDIKNPEYNIYLGAKYQEELSDRYNNRAQGDQLLSYVAAAYNGGPGALENAHFDISKMDNQTVTYVPIVLKNYYKFQKCQQQLSEASKNAGAPGNFLNVPRYTQGRTTCGTTSVDMVVDYHLIKNGKTPYGSRQRCASSTLGQMITNDLAAKGVSLQYTEIREGGSPDRSTFFQYIQGSIDKSAPVIQGVDVFHSNGQTYPSSHGSHFWVIAGYQQTEQGTTYTIIDPNDPNTEYTETESFLWDHRHNSQTKSDSYIVYVP